MRDLVSWGLVGLAIAIAVFCGQYGWWAIPGAIAAGMIVGLRDALRDEGTLP